MAWRGRRQVVLVGSGGDGGMAYGDFGWTHGDLEARSSPWPWEAFRGCLYLWKSLKKKKYKSHPEQEPQRALEGSPMPGVLRAWTALDFAEPYAETRGLQSC